MLIGLFVVVFFYVVERKSLVQTLVHRLFYVFCTKGFKLVHKFIGGHGGLVVIMFASHRWGLGIDSCLLPVCMQPACSSHASGVSSEYFGFRHQT